MSTFFKNKAAGFYLTVIIALLSVVTAIVYAVNYANFLLQGASIMSWPAFALLLIIAIEIVVMNLLKLGKYAPYIVFITALITFCIFIYSMYYYVSVMMMGIDAIFNATFFINAILFAAIYAASIISVFMKQEIKA